MDSGIYQITFPNGQFYLGKSETISQRWKTHQKNFIQGTHTKKMQAAYDEYGQPQYEIILSVHPEHIGIYESIFINSAWNNSILNTTKPKPLDPQIAEQYLEVYDNVTLEGISCMLHSTLQHVVTLREHHTKLDTAKSRVKHLELRGIVLPEETQQQVHELSEVALNYNKELQRLNKLSLWDRVFNYKVYV
jgi:hypothetical protein